ncbi:MAG: hypothetical protein JO112_18195 [Planctomycetes bacterium]|nr:hypothetical protein [Planctomycetota bacterium]
MPDPNVAERGKLGPEPVPDEAAVEVNDPGGSESKGYSADPNPTGDPQEAPLKMLPESGPTTKPPK